MVLPSKKGEIVAMVVHRFIQCKEPTTLLSLVKKFKDPDLIDSLTPVILRAPDCESLWPGVLAFEFCGDPDAARFARRSFETVVHVLQNFFNDETVEKTQFSPAEVEERARGIFGGAERETIMFGLHFVQEFNGIHAGLGGVFPNFTSVVVHRRIGLLTNVPGAWDDYVAKYGPYLAQNHGVAVERRI